MTCACVRADVTAPTAAGMTMVPPAEVAAIARQILFSGRDQRRPRGRRSSASSSAMTAWHRRARRASAAQRRAAAALIAGKGADYAAELVTFMSDIETAAAAA